MENYYKNKGYYEVNITSSSVEYSEDEGFILTYTINAGPRYKFKKNFSWYIWSFRPISFYVTRKEFNKVVGEYYSVRKLTKILEKIDKLSDKRITIHQS